MDITEEEVDTCFKALSEGRGVRLVQKRAGAMLEHNDNYKKKRPLRDRRAPFKSLAVVPANYFLASKILEGMAGAIWRQLGCCLLHFL